MIELASAGTLIWRLTVELRRGQAFSENAERLASRIAGGLLFALAAYVTIAALWSLWTGQGEALSWPGFIVALAAIPSMHYLARRKIAIANKIGSRALMADAMEAVTCGWLSAVVVVMRLSLAPLNLIVWAKTNGGMGGLYRSQHELLPLFKKGSAPHVNNVELGKRRRWRSNVWTYPGASSLGSDARRGLKDRPTVKPTALLEDVLLEVSNRGDIVIDPFPCSGSTLIAAEATGRVCRGVELDPLYVDVIVRRYAATGNQAVLVETGDADLLAARRSSEAAPV